MRIDKTFISLHPSVQPGDFVAFGGKQKIVKFNPKLHWYGLGKFVRETANYIIINQRFPDSQIPLGARRTLKTIPEEENSWQN